MHHLVAFILLLLSSEALSLTCLESADKLGKNRAQFVGYGKAASPELAVQSARIDLAGQIRSTITSSVKETFSTGLRQQEIESASEISERLSDLHVQTRCESKDGDYEAVISLSRSSFLEAEQNALNHFVEESTNLAIDFEKSQDPAVKFQNLQLLRQVYNQQELMRARLESCQALRGCAGQNLNSLQKIAAIQQQNKSLQQFTLVPQNSDAQLVIQEVSGLLSSSGIEIVTAEHKSSGKVLTNCQQRIFPPDPNFTYRMVELRCSAQGMIGDLQVFKHEFSGKGMDNELEEAIKLSRTKLTILE